MTRHMLGLYNTVLLPARALLPLWAAWRGRGPHREEWDQRRAKRLPAAPVGGVWLHGASVGEARIVTEVARALRRRDPLRPLSASAVTPAGRELLPRPPLVDSAFFAPLDFPGFPSRVLAALRPSCLALVETELWPNTIHEARQAGVPLAIVNGRLSARRMSRYRRLRALYAPLLATVARVGARSADDAERFRGLGVAEDRIVVTGNIKYDLPVPPGDAAALRSRIGLAEQRAVFVAGSTRQDEDEQVLDAFEQARRSCPDLFLVLAPRRVARAEPLQLSIRRRGLEAERLSAVDHGAPCPRDVLLVDTLGELSQLYRLGTVAFVGGTLVPVGGHNLLEPAGAGLPVLFGPHVQNVEEPARALLDSKAAWCVRNAEDLAARLIELIADRDAREGAGRRGLQVLQQHRGALESSVRLIEEVIAQARRAEGVA